MTTAVVPADDLTPGAAGTVFRTCPATGRRIDLGAERLIKVHAVSSVVSLLIGAIAAVLVVLTRWQAVHLLPAVWFYRILGVHGMSMLIFFIIFFEMAVLIFASTVLLNARNCAPKISWAAFALMLAGAITVEAMMWTGRADVLFTSYVPLRAEPLVLSRRDPLRRRRARDGRRLLREPRRGAAGADL